METPQPNDDSYGSLLRRVVELTRAEHGCIAFVNPESGALDLVAAHQWDDPAINEMERPIMDRILRQVIATRTPVSDLNYKYEILPRYSVLPPPFRLRCVTCIPWTVRQQPGAVYVQVWAGTFMQAGRQIGESDVEQVQSLLKQYDPVDPAADQPV